MRELQEATAALATALGISGEMQELPQGFTVPDGWTTLAAKAGRWEVAILVTPGTLAALGGEEQGVGTLAEALESQGKPVAAALGADLADEASLSVEGVVQTGYALVDGEIGVAVLVAGASIPSGSAAANDPSQPYTVSETRVVGENDSKMRILSDVEMTVTAELGRAYMTVRELLALTPGSIVELDRVAGTPIDVLVNGTIVARGEVVVVDEEFGVRITEIVENQNV